MASPPLVFLAGVAGTELRAPSPFFFVPDVEIWCRPDRLIAGGMARTRRAIPGESEPPPPGPALVGGGPIGVYYGPCLAVLLGLRYDVRCPALDWRQSYQDDGYYVAAFIRTAFPGGNVTILAHSRGGLVARWACHVLGTQDAGGLVSRVVCLGTPHAGSLAAVESLLGSGTIERSVESLASYFPEYLAANVSPAVVNACVRSWPSVYELLPPPNASWLAPGVGPALYEPATYAGSPVRPASIYLAGAAARWSELPPRPVGVDWIDVAGYGVVTPLDVLGPDDVSRPGEWSRGPLGDGVVPIASAVAGAARRVFTPTGHSALPFDARLWARLPGILLDGLTADLTIPGDPLTI